MRARRFGTIPAALGVGLLLVGCTPPQHGVLGIGKSGDGRPLAVVQMCTGDPVREVGVYDSDSVKGKSWRFPKNVTGFGTLALPGLEQMLMPGHSYFSSSGAETSGAGVEWGPDLTTDAFANLAPGQVLALDFSEHPGLAQYVVYEVPDFVRTVKDKCSDFGG